MVTPGMMGIGKGGFALRTGFFLSTRTVAFLLGAPIMKMKELRLLELEIKWIFWKI